MKRAAILGASGYTGAEMIRLLHAHPRLEIAALTGESRAGQSVAQVHPGFASLKLPDIVKMDAVAWDDIDVAFCCLPHKVSQETVSELMGRVATIIDLSADFRLKSTELYEETYAVKHVRPDLLGKAVYGLSEWSKDALPGAELVACPGCFPTCILLGLAPLLEAGLIDRADIRITAMTGVSGAGRKSAEDFAFSELSDSAKPYGLAGHRHAPEMDQFLGQFSDEPVRVSFVPQLVPMNRGMVATIFVKHGKGSHEDLREALEKRYLESPFVSLLEPGVVPRTRDVRGSNHCHLNIFADRQEGRSIIVSAIDNLTKGSSGQALQNYNLTQGWDETLGLENAPIFP